ncbi:MAG: hypothetical protein HY079_06570, partial [Elusimicrobia bacterium]|nr:hypothetical protein [Elusimicrobiota bacterium]
MIAALGILLTLASPRAHAALAARPLLADAPALSAPAASLTSALAPAFLAAPAPAAS